MSDLRMPDPSRLHLKKELTQIRKAARVLRDPGTTSSWKSPINSSRSVAAAVAAELKAMVMVVLLIVMAMRKIRGFSFIIGGVRNLHQ